MSVYMELEPYLYDSMSADLYAQARMGDNGDVWGMTEWDIATATDFVGSYVRWDLDLSDGMDTSWNSVQFYLGANGHVEWAMAGSGTLVTDVAPIGPIREVDVLAVAAIPGVSFQWIDLEADFFRGGTMTEQISVPNNEWAQASTMNGGMSQQAITHITPTAQNNYSVIVTARIRLQAKPGIFPSGNDVFGQVLINPAHA